MYHCQSHLTNLLAELIWLNHFQVMAWSGLTFEPEFGIGLQDYQIINGHANLYIVFTVSRLLFSRKLPVHSYDIGLKDISVHVAHDTLKTLVKFSLIINQNSMVQRIRLVSTFSYSCFWHSILYTVWSNFLQPLTKAVTRRQIDG